MKKITCIGCFNASSSVNLDVSRTNDGFPNLASKNLLKNLAIFYIIIKQSHTFQPQMSQFWPYRYQMQLMLIQLPILFFFKYRFNPKSSKQKKIWILTVVTILLGSSTNA